ncbi:MAG: hypothetical protein JOY61_02285 [Chloroflexi bacterium]|nr:hypothetical protein [Chloroflexota bacterium]
MALASQLIPSLRAHPTLVVLDLDVCLSIQLAGELFRRRAAHPVLLVPRWPYAEAVLPLEPMLTTLLSEAATLPPSTRRLPSVAFALDDRRNMPVPGRPPDDIRADNRYRLGVADLPDLRTLRTRGITRVLKLSHACAR